MAKMTMFNVTYEGTPEELREVVRTFEVDTVAEPDGLKTEKRPAKVGERIMITDAHPGREQKYSIGDVFTVIREDACANNDVEVEGQPSFIDYTEYEVIVEPAQAKPKLTHKGADYTLVQRKAQAGDVVVPTENNNRYFTNGKAYGPVTAPLNLIDNDGDTLGVYSLSNGRTEANVLVYEKVAVEAPKRFPQYGDIVRVTSDHYHNGFTEGAIGIVADADGTFSPEIKVCGKRGYARVEIVADVESRSDMR